MFNHVMLVGRVVEKSDIQEVDGESVIKITLAVERPFKNLMGEFACDNISITMWSAIAETVEEVIGNGCMIACKGRLVSKSITTNENIVMNVVEVIAERVVAMAPKKEL